MSINRSVTEDDLEYFRKFLERLQKDFVERLDPELAKGRTEREALVNLHVPKQGIWTVRVEHTPIYPRRRRNPPIGSVKA